jgi:hypothetical protein
VDLVLRRLKLSRMLDILPERLTLARQQRFRSIATKSLVHAFRKPVDPMMRLNCDAKHLRNELALRFRRPRPRDDRRSASARPSLGCEHGSARLGRRDDERIDGGAAASLPAQERRPSREWLGHLLHDVARL